MFNLLKNVYQGLGAILLLVAGFSNGAYAHKPFTVGSTTVFFHDTTRGFDPVGGVTKGVRILPIEIWYPVDNNQVDEQSVKAKISDYFFGSISAYKQLMSSTYGFDTHPSLYKENVTNILYFKTLYDTFIQERNSYLNTPVSTKGPFPVILCSPASTGHRMSFQKTAEDLASHGYIVLACDHTGSSLSAQIDYDPNPALLNRGVVSFDSTGCYAPTCDSLNELISFVSTKSIESGTKFVNGLEQRCLDIQGMVDFVKKLNTAQQGFLANTIDISKLGILGHSLGADAGRAALKTLPELKAGTFVVADDLPSLATLFPLESLSALDNGMFWKWNTNHVKEGEKKPILFFQAKEDDSAYTLNTLYAKLGLVGITNESNPYPEISHAFNRAKGAAWLLTMGNTNHDSHEFNYPINLMPELAATEFSAVYLPSKKYKALSSDITTRARNVKIRAFFDLYLRQRATAQKVLLDSKYSIYGLTIKNRNTDTK